MPVVCNAWNVNLADSHGTHQEAADIALSASSHARSMMKVRTNYTSFLDSKPATSFHMVHIQFRPKAAEPKEEMIKCEEDHEVCIEECRYQYSQRPEIMQAPCIDAVDKNFGHGMCFPGSATVRERRRGIMCIADVQVGDEVQVSHSAFSRVVALLHCNADAFETYLQFDFNSSHDSQACLSASPHHLIRVRPHRGTTEKTDPHLDEVGNYSESLWSWKAAETVSVGDELQFENGDPVVVTAISRARCPGVFAPLTMDGELVVNGVLCSCYAPPVAFSLSHSACHNAMLPLRMLDVARSAVETWSADKDGKNPLLTVDALWLLPRVSDISIHPWPSGLLKAASSIQRYFRL